MRTTFLTALLVGVVLAKNDKVKAKGDKTPKTKSVDERYVEYVGKQNKQKKNASEFEAGKAKFAVEIEKIDKQNAKKMKKDDLELAENFLTDMEEDEKMALLGLLVPADADTTGFGKRDGGRRLTHAATTVDHHIDGFMHPVKDQGGCGSCWAFAANTALEGTIAKKTNSAAVRISEQQLVDCTLRQNTFNKNLFGKDYGLWGCGGGWMDVAWQFQTEQGYMLDSDYPYTSRTTRTETQCAHDPSKVVGNASGYRRITDVDTMKTVVQAQPVSIALDAGQAAFQYYKSGVVQMADNCGTSLNHAVVVVGYSDGEGGGDVVPPAPELTCNVTKWWHTCTDESGARMLQGADSQGLNNYWKIQNSWGSGWGDGGFIRIAIEESGQGVCGMYSYIESIERASGY